MAFLTALLSALTRKLGSFVQALMGWSVAALFGRLEPPKRLMVSIALILSVLWPFFVVGLFFPAAAAAFLTFVPVERFVGRAIVRVIWIALALFAPLVVGLLVRAVAGARARGVLVSALNGYPLALGFAISFLVTVLTVPAIKLASAARRWSDQHVFVQPKPGHYLEAVDELRDACVRVGLQPEVRKLPWSMALATQVIKFFARGGLDALVVDEPKLVRARDVELYLYPGDLLIRGTEHLVARVRALLGHTRLDEFAWLVSGAKAQHLQDELARVEGALHRHVVPGVAAPLLQSRLTEIAVASTTPEVTYEDWVMLDRVTRRVENKLHGKDLLTERKSEELAAREVLKKDPAAELGRGSTSALHTPPSEASAVDLLKAALDESRELVRLEVALAKTEAEKQVRQAVRAAIWFGVAAALAIMGLALFPVAIVLALGGDPLDAVAVGVITLVLGGAVAWLGYARIPKKPLEHTRQHVEDDVKHLKEHLA